MNKQKNIAIFTQKLCGYLMMKGFVLIDLKPHENKSGRNVFYFNNTPEIIKAIEEYKSM